MNIIKPALLTAAFAFILGSCTSASDTAENRKQYSSVDTTAVSGTSAFTPSVTEALITTAATSAVTTVSVPPPDEYTINGVELIWQNPELPTGCEVTSLAILLNYLGFSVSKTELAEKYLAKDYNGKLSLKEAFLGDPSWAGGFGCFSPVIVDTAVKYLKDQKSSMTPKDVSGTEFKDLYSYIAADMPVIVWASMELCDVYRYHCYTTEAGEDQYFYDNEHCMVIFGYDRNSGTVTAADPLDGIIRYSAERFEYIYNQLEKQAVIIEKNSI